MGGWTRWTETDPQEQIYIYDTTDGALSARLDGLPNVTLALAFSLFTFDLGWRHMALEYDEGGVDLDLTFSGPLIGFTFGL